MAINLRKVAVITIGVVLVLTVCCGAVAKAFRKVGGFGGGVLGSWGFMKVNNGLKKVSRGFRSVSLRACQLVNLRVLGFRGVKVCKVYGFGLQDFMA